MKFDEHFRKERTGHLQGSPHLQKTGRIDSSLREHEGEGKA